MENSGENQQKQQDNEKQKDTSFVIRIPSYDEVAESSQSKTAPQSLFTPSPSFSQAFNFVKNSEFYTTPPPPPPSQPVEVTPSPSHTPPPRQSVHSEAPSTSVASAGGSRNSILVSHRQKGNPLLKHIRNVRWAYADIVCDYLLGQNACALYLSLRYHLLHPDYLYFRIRELQKNFKLRVVLCHVDVEDVVKPLHEVTKTALLHDCTLLCAWSLEECGRYLETIKVYENKPADIILGQMDMDYLSRLNHALTSVRHVNKTDVVTLGSTFGVQLVIYVVQLIIGGSCFCFLILIRVIQPQSLSNIMDASMDDLARCPGIGEKKVKRLYDTFHEPFKRAVPNSIAPVSENPTNNKAEVVPETEKNEDENMEEVPESSTRQKKEAEVSVKSALEAAFAKYPGVIGRKKNTQVVQDDKKDKNGNEAHKTSE